MTLPSQQEVFNARQRIAAMVHHTPVLRSRTLNDRTGAEVFLKCENFQRMGAYKMRGAAHALSVLSPDALSKGVVTHSSGNFAQALALSARVFHVPATIVMPENAPKVKVDAVKGYGAEIIFSDSNPADRERKTEEVLAARGSTFIHPSNDLQVILGNSSCALELLEEIADFDIVIAPVGGGGLLAGTALAVHYYSPGTEVIAAEPAHVDDAYRSLKSGQIEYNQRTDTIADGLRTHLGDINFPIIKQLVKRVLLVDEQEIIDAMFWIWQRMKIIIEPSSAVAVAALFRYPDVFDGKRVGVIISGGNVDQAEMCKLLP